MPKFGFVSLCIIILKELLQTQQQYVICSGFTIVDTFSTPSTGNTRIASSPDSKGFLSTLPGDSSWKTEEAFFHSRH